MESKRRFKDDPEGQPSEEKQRPDSGPITSLIAETRDSSERPVVLIGTLNLRVRAFGATILQAAGFHVEVAAHGSRIMTLSRSRLPDLVVTDYLLEDMHALRLCSQIRQLRGGTTVPILVVSDLTDTTAIQKLLREDFTDVVLSPVNWKLLSFRVHRWIVTAGKYRSLNEQEQDLEQVRDHAVKASTELLQLRNYDSVTGLPNREMFLSTAGLLISQVQRNRSYLAVLFLDIDQFREVNALLGRPIANELLRLVAQRLQQVLRQEHADLDEMGGEDRGVASLARLAADQFAAIVTTAADASKAAEIAEHLVESLAKGFSIGDRDLQLRARVGIAECVDNEEVAEDILLQRAEIALRYCKQQPGRNVSFFEKSMDELVLRKVELKEELRRAIDRDELFLCYQFLVDSKTSVPNGVEALVRWRHPTRGEVSPKDFLPVAEESDLIVEIDRWVLREGCRQGKRWLESGWPPILFSLNLSMRFLEEDDFAQQIHAVLDETGFPASSLQLELSERGTLPDAGRVMAQFEALVLRGIRLAIDDFGTGQTSLSYLRNLPIRCVKVDQSFVKRIPGDTASAAIVTAIAAMSTHLGLKVVAEGVETRDQWQFLESTGYDTLQGFLFSRPETEEKLTRLLRADARKGKEVEVWPAMDHPDWDLEPARDVEDPEQGFETQEGTGRSEERKVGIADEALEPKVTVLPPAATEPVEMEGFPDWIAGDGDSWSHSDSYLQQLARRDFLTQLFNRFSFDEQLERSAASAERYDHRMALLTIDLDDFKYVNDTHGHAVGDGLLVALADRLKKLVRSSDMLARVGGDEFSVILSEFQDLGDVAEFAGRLVTILAEPVYFENRELRITCSLGISIFPTGSSQVRDMVRQADLALYKAKSAGGNSFRFFSEEMGEEVRRGMELSRDLEGVIGRGELALEYQPRIDLVDGRIVGVEALLRWHHPEEGLIGPGEFIPIAEHSGEIRSIGRWVLREACAQASIWSNTIGREIPVSINLSVVQCRDEGFSEQVMQVLQEHAWTPNLLDFELAESLLARLPKELEEPLRKLSETGVGLTLDNFGAGDSALSHFQRFRFDRLKVHQSLIRSIGSPSVVTSVLRGILALAQKMKVEIIAEGVETVEELASLRAEGCQSGQGFLISKPLPMDDLIDWMQDWEFTRKDDLSGVFGPGDSSGSGSGSRTLIAPPSSELTDKAPQETEEEEPLFYKSPSWSRLEREKTVERRPSSNASRPAAPIRRAPTRRAAPIRPSLSDSLGPWQVATGVLLSILVVLLLAGGATPFLDTLGRILGG